MNRGRHRGLVEQVDTAQASAVDRSRRYDVELEKVRFAWTRNSPDVLNIERFEVERGERVFIDGPSGSGKSTLLSLLGGVMTARDGQVKVLGNELSQWSGRRRDRFRADHVGFVFQMFNLVPYLSVIDNVTLPCRFSQRRRRQAAAQSNTVDIEACRLLADLNLDHGELRHRRVTDLSIGQQQRVAVARALIGSPDLVIADEPTSALDEGTRERFLELLFAECAAQRTTLLFVSHDARLGALFERRVSLMQLNSIRHDSSA